MTANYMEHKRHEELFGKDSERSPEQLERQFQSNKMISVLRRMHVPRRYSSGLTLLPG